MFLLAGKYNGWGVAKTAPPPTRLLIEREDKTRASYLWNPVFGHRISFGWIHRLYRDFVKRVKEASCIYVDLV